MQSIEWQRLRAQGLVEFGLLLALVAVVAIAGLMLFGSTVTSMISSLSYTVLSNVQPSP